MPGRRGWLEQSETMGRGGGMGRMKETKVRGEWRVREGGIGCTQVQDRWKKSIFI